MRGRKGSGARGLGCPVAATAQAALRSGGVSPINGSARSGIQARAGGRLVGSGRAGRTRCRPRSGIPSCGRGRRGPRWRAGRRSGRGVGSALMVGLYRARPKQERSAPGSYRIHRDGLVLWRPGHRPSLARLRGGGSGGTIGSAAGSAAVPGANRRRQCGVARKREPVSSPRRPRMRRKELGLEMRSDCIDR